MAKLGDPDEFEQQFESYKLIVEDLSRIRQQRGRTIDSYITINSVILAASALLLRETGLDIGWEALLIALLLLVGVVVSLRWRLLVPQYITLVNARVGTLERIEKEMASRIPRLFTDEAKEFNERSAQHYTWLDRVAGRIRWDLRLPMFFLVVYAAALGGVVLVVLGTISATDSCLESVVSTVLRVIRWLS